MRGRNKPWAKDFIAENANLLYNNQEENSKELTLEIGIGKGDFIVANAKENTDYLHIGVELNTSIFAIAMKKIVNDKMFDLKIRIDKDPKFKALFEKNFELAYVDDGLNIQVLSNYKSTIPEKYRNLIYDHFDGPYTNKISKGFRFFSSDIEDKTSDYLFEYLKNNCEMNLENFQHVDSEISQYLSLLGQGYTLSTCWGRCQCK